MRSWALVADQLTLPKAVSRYQTSAPGALYLIFSTFHAPSVAGVPLLAYVVS